MTRHGDGSTRFTKASLPHKTCVACKRPFAWRKKWARDWGQVKYCSERCKRAGEPPPARGPAS